MSNEEEVAPPKKRKMKIILLILLLLLLSAGGAATYWWFEMRTPSDDDVAQEITEGTSEAPQEVASGASSKGSTATATTTATPPASMPMSKTEVNLVNIPTVTVNLVDTDPVRYLRVGLDIEVNTKDAVNALNTQLAKVRDSIIIILSGKTYEELATTAGKLSIKNDIIMRLNQILGAPRVVQIYFTEFVVQ